MILDCRFTVCQRFDHIWGKLVEVLIVWQYKWLLYKEWMVPQHYILQIVLFWIAESFNLIVGCQRFGGKCYFHLQSWRLWQDVALKLRYPSMRLHGVTTEESTVLAVIAMQTSEQFWRRKSGKSGQSKDLGMQILLVWWLMVPFDAWCMKWPLVVYFTMLSISILCNIRTLLCHLPRALCARTLGFEHATIAAVSVINLCLE